MKFEVGTDYRHIENPQYGVYKCVYINSIWAVLEHTEDKVIFTVKLDNREYEEYKEPREWILFLGPEGLSVRGPRVVRYDETVLVREVSSSRSRI